jgi:hypothetical protein
MMDLAIVRYPRTGNVKAIYCAGDKMVQKDSVNNSRPCAPVTPCSTSPTKTDGRARPKCKYQGTDDHNAGPDRYYRSLRANFVQQFAAGKLAKQRSNTTCREHEAYLGLRPVGDVGPKPANMAARKKLTRSSPSRLELPW